MTHFTYRLTANYRDQLRKPTLGNRSWAAFSVTRTLDTAAAVTFLRRLLAPVS